MSLSVAVGISVQFGVSSFSVHMSLVTRCLRHRVGVEMNSATSLGRSSGKMEQ